jgi:hypothetical protein
VPLLIVPLTPPNQDGGLLLVKTRLVVIAVIATTLTARPSAPPIACAAPNNGSPTSAILPSAREPANGPTIPFQDLLTWSGELITAAEQEQDFGLAMSKLRPPAGRDGLRPSPSRVESSIVPFTFDGGIVRYSDGSVGLSRPIPLNEQAARKAPPATVSTPEEVAADMEVIRLALESPGGKINDHGGTGVLGTDDRC